MKRVYILFFQQFVYCSDCESATKDTKKEYIMNPLQPCRKYEGLVSTLRYFEDPIISLNNIFGKHIISSCIMVRMG